MNTKAYVNHRQTEKQTKIINKVQSEHISLRYLLIWSKSVGGPQINTTEETFQSDIIDSTIFQTNSFDFLSEFA